MSPLVYLEDSAPYNITFITSTVPFIGKQKINKHRLGEQKFPAQIGSSNVLETILM